MTVFGMNDTLTGLIDSLVCQSYELFETKIIRAYLNELANDKISQYKK